MRAVTNANVCSRCERLCSNLRKCRIGSMARAVPQHNRGNRSTGTRAFDLGGGCHRPPRVRAATGASEIAAQPRVAMPLMFGEQRGRREVIFQMHRAQPSLRLADLRRQTIQTCG
jgi:hypothetical protein